MKHILRSSIGLTAALAVVVIAGGVRVAGQNQEEFRFKSGVDLVNVTRRSRPQRRLSPAAP